jgi:hypothetical protein
MALETKDMRRVRNPRYAPEFLERKLSPSYFAGNPGVAALVSTPDPAAVQNNAPAANDSTFDVGTGDPTDSDPAVTDPTNVDTTNIDVTLDDPSDATDSGSDADPDPDADPDDPEPTDDPGRPPFVPLPPAPIGPEAAAF